MFKKIRYILLSMNTVFKHLFRRPVTLEYPEKKKEPPENFRGKPVVDSCIKCGTCLRVCPTGAIGFEDDTIVIDLKKCIFCGNCAYYCPKGTIKMSKEYELATDNVEDLKLKYIINSIPLMKGDRGGGEC